MSAEIRSAAERLIPNPFQTAKIMSKNPKVTIALVFVLTFLIGLGAGYLLCGSLQHYVHAQEFYPVDDPDDPERIAPDRMAPEPAPMTSVDERAEMDGEDEALAPRGAERANGERAREGERAGSGGGYGPGQGRRFDAGDITAEETVAAVVDATAAEVTDTDEDTVAESIGDKETAPRYRSDTDDRTSERRYRRMDAETDTADRPADYRERDRQWRSDSDRSAFSRFRIRLIRDLSLSEEDAEAFFSLLEDHRRQVREEVIIPQRVIREKHRELSEQLERDLSALLSEEQMEVWKERFAPRMDRTQRRPSPDNEE